MSWPNKSIGKSVYLRSIDTSDATLVRGYIPIVRSGKVLELTGLYNLSALYNSGVKSLVGNLISSKAASASAFSASAYYPTAAAQSFTTTILSKGVVDTNGIYIGSAQAAGGGTAGWFIIYNSGSAYIAIQSNAGGASGYYTKTVTVPALLNTMLISAKVDHVTPLLYLSINGVPYTSGRVVGTIVGYGAQGLCLGGRDSADALALTGLVGETAIYSELKSDSWIRSKWVKIARAAQLKTGWGSKVSIANENTVGNFVGNGSTPFEILSGTWKVSTQTVDGELHKVIECVAAGTVWLDRKFMNVNSSEAAYGGWRFFVSHATSATPTTIALTATAKNTPAVTTGYYLRVYDTETREGRYSAGVYTDFETLATGGGSTVPIEVQVRRRFDNVWQHHNRRIGQAWLTSGSDTDATYLTSEGVSITANAGDWISLGTVRDTYALTKYLGEFDPAEV
jgi:hypothetical protein